MEVKLKRSCSLCHGTGEYVYNRLTSSTRPCHGCESTGWDTIAKFELDLSDIEDKLDDILDKCNDIFEKVSEP